MRDGGSDGPPEYNVYRSRPGPFRRLRPGVGLGRRRRREELRPGEPPPLRPRRRLTPGRVLRLLVLAVLAWLLVSLLVFVVSAQFAPGVPGRAERVLAGGSSLLTGSTVLVLGSDQRPPGTKEPGAGGPGRADSILLLRASFGSLRRLSVLRDSYAPIPGFGAQKINASYALGGSPLAVQTVEGFLGNGLEVHHLVEVDFQRFPAFIDALGGIDVELRRCVSSAPFGGRPFRLRRGEHHLNGRQALAFARVRANRCAPNEDDRARARRQQQVLGAIRSRLFSPAAFVRLPVVAWQAPRTLRTDMKAPGLLGLFVAVATGGAGDTNVLRPSGPGPGGSLVVSEADKREAVRGLLGG